MFMGWKIVVLYEDGETSVISVPNVEPEDLNRMLIIVQNRYNNLGRVIKNLTIHTID